MREGRKGHLHGIAIFLRQRLDSYLCFTFTGDFDPPIDSFLRMGCHFRCRVCGLLAFQQLQYPALQFQYSFDASHDSKTGLLQRHHAKYYYANYWFKNDSLYVYEFGFREPNYEERLQWEKKMGLNQD